MFFALRALFGGRKGVEPLTREALDALADEALMERYAAGDAVAFEVLFARHERGVLSFVFRSVRHRERAEELTQDVFLRVVRNASKYRPNAKFTTWLYTIARNACIDESRRASKRRHASLDASLDDEGGGATFKDRVVDLAAASGAGEISRAQFREALAEGLDALPDEQREVFVLRHVEGLKFVDIAEMTGVSENTVKSRMRYAMQALRGYVASFEGHSFDDDDLDEVGDRDARRQV